MLKNQAGGKETQEGENLKAKNINKEEMVWNICQKKG